MSDSESGASQAPKPSRLSGLIAPKGTAARPGEALQPAVPPAPASAPAPRPEPAQPVRAAAPAPAAVPIGTGSKSLTLRLPDAEYERLRSHAFVTRKTHQAILAEALRQYLDAASSK